MPIGYDFEWPEKCVDTNYYLIWWRNDSLKYIKHLVIIYNAMDCAEIEKKNTSDDWIVWNKSCLSVDLPAGFSKQIGKTGNFENVEKYRGKRVNAVICR